MSCDFAPAPHDMGSFQEVCSPASRPPAAARSGRKRARRSLRRHAEIRLDLSPSSCDAIYICTQLRLVADPVFRGSHTKGSPVRGDPPFCAAGLFQKGILRYSGLRLFMHDDIIYFNDVATFDRLSSRQPTETSSSGLQSIDYYCLLIPKSPRVPAMTLEKPEWKDSPEGDDWNIPKGEFTVFGTASLSQQEIHVEQRLGLRTPRIRRTGQSDLRTTHVKCAN